MSAGGISGFLKGNQEVSVSRLGSLRPSADFQIAISFHSLFRGDHNRPDSGGFVEPEHLPAPNATTCDREEHPCNPPGLAPQTQDSAPGTGPWPQVEAEFAGFVPCKDLQQLHNSAVERVIKEELEFRLCPGEILIFVPCRC